MNVMVITSSGELCRMIQKGVCMVDFHAPWCAPCKAQEPIIQNLAREFNGRATVLTMNTDDHQDVAAALKIEHIPTLIIFHKGREVMRLWGLQPEEALSEALDRVLKHKV